MAHYHYQIFYTLHYFLINYYYYFFKSERASARAGAEGEGERILSSLHAQHRAPSDDLEIMT